MSNSISFVPIGIAICYCYMTLRESNKVDIIRPWYELNFLESLAIVYCILISSIRANWIFFTSLLQIGIIAVLVIMVWYVVYNIEEFKNMVILIIRQNSLEGENNLEIDLESTLTENANEPKTENKMFENKTIEFEMENDVEEPFSDIDKNLDILVPEIDKIIENISVDTQKFIEYVEHEGDTNKISNTEQTFTSKLLVSELERITDNLVRDTKKIADNVSLVSSMIVETSGVDSNTYENENTVLKVTPVVSNASMETENIREDLEIKSPVSTKKNDIIPVPKEMDMRSESEIEEEARLISNAENMINVIENFVEAINK